MGSCPERHPSGERCGLEAGHRGNHRLQEAHRCHARGCVERVRPEMLMCRAHWFRVPRRIQSAVYAAYRRGQCNDKNPSKAWHTAADAAIGFVATLDDEPLPMAEVNALKVFGYTVRCSKDGKLEAILRREAEKKKQA